MPYASGRSAWTKAIEIANDSGRPEKDAPISREDVISVTLLFPDGGEIKVPEGSLLQVRWEEHWRSKEKSIG